MGGGARPLSSVVRHHETPSLQSHGGSAIKTVRRQALLHFGMTVAGLLAFATVMGLLGSFEPFWKGGKGVLLLAIGVPVLVVESLVFLLLMHRTLAAMDGRGAVAVATAAFFCGMGLPLVYGTLFWNLAVQFGSSDHFMYALLVATIICGVVSTLLTRALWAIQRQLARTSNAGDRRDA